MFQLKLHLLEKVLRPIIVYVFLVAALRIFGKRELAQLNPFDLVVLLSLSNTVQNAIIGDDNSVTGGVAGALALLAVNYLVARLLFHHRRLNEWVTGKATVLLEHGKLHRRALEKELLTEQELNHAAHKQGFANWHELDYAALEPDGTFTMKSNSVTQSERQQQQLLDELTAIKAQLAALQQNQSRIQTGH
ncbi:MAG: DUF421 domain-containing protein [Acidobacteria bacterium]|nr:DUF421 domain-containing protein [Acidobacteriota bacterium]